MSVCENETNSPTFFSFKSDAHLFEQSWYLSLKSEALTSSFCRALLIWKKNCPSLTFKWCRNKDSWRSTKLHMQSRFRKDSIRPKCQRCQVKSLLEVIVCCSLLLFSHRKASHTNIVYFVCLWKIWLGVLESKRVFWSLSIKYLLSTNAWNGITLKFFNCKKAVTVQPNKILARHFMSSNASL